jgi:NAD-dependent dihydropyrimidine dehydrogenase PreA subunit
MNRLLTEEKYGDVLSLVESELGSGGLNCFTCKAFCENACRRKKIDIPVSIRNMRMFIAGELGRNGDQPVTGRRNKEFSSRTGKVEPEELQQWLKECMKDYPRHRDISSRADARDESSACMHCDCRAAGDCRLRDMANSFSLKDPAKVVNAPIEKKINHKTGLVLENAKCIKCGLCVRVVDDSTDEPGLCFVNRGFVSIISEPLTSDFQEVLLSKSGRFVEACPTGALSFVEGRERGAED